MPDTSIFTRLMGVIEDRKRHPATRSYTESLLAGGVDRIGHKILEEAQEVVDAAKETSAARQSHVVHEAADLVYHLFVLLGHCDVRLEMVEQELARRFGTSGLDEKAARKGSGAEK